MALPEMQITDSMRKAAEEMVYGYYMQNHQRHKLTPKGATWYYDAKQSFTQTAFDANPQYSAFASKPSGRPGYPLEYIRLGKPEQQEAKAAFDGVLATLATEAIQRLKGGVGDRKVPADFSFKGDSEYYGNGYPPQGVPAELRGVETGWAEKVGPRKDIPLG